MNEDAIALLGEDIVEYADISEAVSRYGFSVDYLTSDGIVVSGRRRAMAAIFQGGNPGIVARHIPRRHGYTIHSDALFGEFTDRYQPEEEPQLTWQFVYTGNGLAAELPAGCSIRRLGMEDFDFVHSHYKLGDAAYVASRLKAGAIIGLEADGELVGFVGRHAEGSMGMLEVREDRRRRGYGELLERVMITDVIDEGAIPFCHIIDGNTKSLLLQRKLGLEEAGNPAFWI